PTEAFAGDPRATGDAGERRPAERERKVRRVVEPGLVGERSGCPLAHQVERRSLAGHRAGLAVGCIPAGTEEAGLERLEGDQVEDLLTGFDHAVPLEVV